MESKIIEGFNKGEGFIKENGFKIVELNSKHCLMEYKVKKSGLNPYGIVHGGILFGLADTCAGALAFMTGNIPLTTNANMNYLTQVTGKKIIAEATILKESKKIGYYSVNIYDEKNNLLAQANVNMYFKEMDKK